MFEKLTNAICSIGAKNKMYKVYAEEHAQATMRFRRAYNDMMKANQNYSSAVIVMSTQLNTNKGAAGRLSTKFEQNSIALNTALGRKVATLLTQAVMSVPVEELYVAVMPYLDRDGYRLSNATQEVLGIKNFDRHYVEEDSAGRLETMKGHGMVKLMELTEMGEPHYSYQGCYELLAGGTPPDPASEDYLAYKEKQIVLVVRNMVEYFSTCKVFSSCTTDDFLDAIQVLKTIINFEGKFVANREKYAKVAKENERESYEEFIGDYRMAPCSFLEERENIEHRVYDGVIPGADSFDCMVLRHARSEIDYELASNPFITEKSFGFKWDALLKQIERMDGYCSLIADAILDTEDEIEAINKFTFCARRALEEESISDAFAAFAMREYGEKLSAFGITDIGSTEELFSVIEQISAK